MPSRINPNYTLPEYSPEIRVEIHTLLTQVVERFREVTPMDPHADSIKRAVAKHLSVPQLIGTVEILLQEIDRLNSGITK